MARPAAASATAPVNTTRTATDGPGRDAVRRPGRRLVGARPADHPRRRCARAAAGGLAGAASAACLGVHDRHDRNRRCHRHHRRNPVDRLGIRAARHAERRICQRRLQPAHHRARRRGSGHDRPGRALRPRPLRHGAARVRRVAAGIRRGRRRDGRRQRPHRAVPGPRIALDRPVRADCTGGPACERPRVRHEVLRAGCVQLGVLPVRHRAGLRGHRRHQSQPDLGVPLRDGPRQ